MKQAIDPVLLELLARRDPPCVSLYMPTHRAYPDRRQDPVRFRNLLRRAKASLRRAHDARSVEALLEPLTRLAEYGRFWDAGVLGGLATFVAPGFVRTLRLHRPVDELAIVADSFHAKPLIRHFQSADRFQVLCLSRRAVRLLEGDRDALDEVELAEGVPRTLEEALGDETTDPHLTVASYGHGAWSPGAPHGAPAMHHGHGGRKDEVDLDVERFFRAVDRAIDAHHSRPTGLPLLLAALPEHHATFHKISRNPMLLPEGVEGNPDAFDEPRLRREAWAYVRPGYLDQLAGLIERFGGSRSRGLAADDLEVLAASAFAGRIDTLLVEDGRQRPGRLVDGAATWRRSELADPRVDDLLDDLAEAVLRSGGRVVVAPPEAMPTSTGAAAIFRY